MGESKINEVYVYIGILFGIISLMFFGLFGYEVLVADEPNLLRIVVSLVFLLIYQIVWFNEALQGLVNQYNRYDKKDIELSFISSLIVGTVGILSWNLFPLFVPVHIRGWLVTGSMSLTLVICRFLIQRFRN